MWNLSNKYKFLPTPSCFHVKLLPLQCAHALTHWSRVTHIWVNKPNIVSDNGLSPAPSPATTRTNDGILLIGPLGTNFSEILVEIHIFCFKKMHLKMSSGKCCPYCLGLNVLTNVLTSIYRNVKFSQVNGLQLSMIHISCTVCQGPIWAEPCWYCFSTLEIHLAKCIHLHSNIVAALAKAITYLPHSFQLWYIIYIIYNSLTELFAT